MSRKEKAEQLLSSAILVALGFAASVTKDYISPESGPWPLVVIWGIVLGSAGFYYYAVLRESATKSDKTPLSSLDLVPHGSTRPRMTRSRKKGETIKPTQRAPNSRTNDAIACSHGPHAVESGHSEAIPLDVRSGDKVHGYLEETDGYEFSWMLLDASNLAKFRQGRRPVVLAEGVNVPGDSLEVVIPHEGRWYLVLDVHGKQYTREVVTDLWRVRRSE